MAVELTREQVLQLRMRGQGLLPPYIGGPDVTAAVARQTCGLQAQDLFAATLGVRVRVPGSTLAHVEHARYEARSVVWTWAMRGTLHLLAGEDIDWLLRLIGGAMSAAAARRRAELGVDDETYGRAVDAIRERIIAEGPALREELGQVLAEAGMPSGYPAERHILYRAALEGVVCLGRDRGAAPGANPIYVLLEDWLGRGLRREPYESREKDTALLATRYLAAYAPATLPDFSAWSGMTVRDLRAGWESAAAICTEVTVEGKPALVPTPRLRELDEPAPRSPHVRLLPAFDTYLLGHRSRDLVIDPAYAGRINAGGGMIRAVVLVDGRIRGTWLANRKGRKVAITVAPFDELPAEIEEGVAAEIADIERFLA